MKAEVVAALMGCAPEWKLKNRSAGVCAQSKHAPPLIMHALQDLGQDLVFLRMGSELLQRLDMSLVHGAVVVRSERDVCPDAGEMLVDVVLNLEAVNKDKERAPSSRHIQSVSGPGPCYCSRCSTFSTWLISEPHGVDRLLKLYNPFLASTS